MIAPPFMVKDEPAAGMSKLPCEAALATVATVSAPPLMLNVIFCVVPAPLNRPAMLSAPPSIMKVAPFSYCRELPEDVPIL